MHLFNNGKVHKLIWKLCLSEGQSMVASTPAFANTNMVSSPTSITSPINSVLDSTPVHQQQQQAQQVQAAVHVPQQQQQPQQQTEMNNPAVIDQVVALYDFQTTTPGTIGFPKDAIINILEKSSDWWLGEYNGNVGLLPNNYVESIKKSNRKSICFIVCRKFFFFFSFWFF